MLFFVGMLGGGNGGVGSFGMLAGYGDSDSDEEPSYVRQPTTKPCMYVFMSPTHMNESCC